MTPLNQLIERREAEIKKLHRDLENSNSPFFTWTKIVMTREIVDFRIESMKEAHSLGKKEGVEETVSGLKIHFKGKWLGDDYHDEAVAREIDFYLKSIPKESDSSKE